MMRAWERVISVNMRSGEAPRKLKPPGFAFTVEEVSEAELKRQAARVEPELTDDADPGRLEWPMVAIVLLLLPLVYWLQQWTRTLHGETLSTAPAEVRRSEEVRDPGVAELTILSKFAVKLAFLDEQEGDREPHQPLSVQKEKSKEESKEKGRASPALKKPATPPPEEDEECGTMRRRAKTT